MVFIDHTADFKRLVGERSRGSARPASPRDKGKGKAGAGDEEFLKEAYRIHAHLGALTSLLHTVRKPYLSLDPPPLSRRNRPATYDNGDGIESETGEGWAKRWEGSKWLTDRERDEIDLRGRMILRRCKERVGDMERAEKARQITTAPISFIQSLFPGPSQSTSSITFEPLYKAHRSSVIWTLNNQLAKASRELTDLQEERGKRREERGRTLGGQAAREAAKLDSTGVGVGGGSVSSALNWFANGDSSTSSGNKDLALGLAAPEESIENQLTPSQLQQLESENSTLLNQMESTLTSVLAAEKSLLEVSALQTELVRNLVQQTEVTDRLYEEAVGSVAELGKANVQLKQAKKRGEEGRLFLVIFLLGASFALLFLDWYAS